MQPCILMFESDADGGASLLPILERTGLRVSRCQDRLSLLEEIVRCRPRVVVYTLQQATPSDRSMLELLHRLAPGLPVGLVATEASLEVERLASEIKPFYFGVAAEAITGLGPALRAALGGPPTTRH